MVIGSMKGKSSFIAAKEYGCAATRFFEAWTDSLISVEISGFDFGVKTV